MKKSPTFIQHPPDRRCFLLAVSFGSVLITVTIKIGILHLEALLMFAIWLFGE